MHAQKRFKKESSKNNSISVIEQACSWIIILVGSAGSSYSFFSDNSESFFYAITKFCGQFGFLLVLVALLIVSITRRINRTTQQDRVIFALRKVLVRYRNDVFADLIDSNDPDFELKNRVTVFQRVDKISRKELKRSNCGDSLNNKKLKKNTGWLKPICRSARHMHLDEITCFVCSPTNSKMCQGVVGHIHKTNNTQVKRINIDLTLDSNGSKIEKYARLTYCTESSVSRLIDSGKNIPRSIAGFGLITPDAREYVVILDSVLKKGVPDTYCIDHSMGVNAIKILLEALE